MHKQSLETRVHMTNLTRSKYSWISKITDISEKINKPDFSKSVKGVTSWGISVASNTNLCKVYSGKEGMKIKAKFKAMSTGCIKKTQTF